MNKISLFYQRVRDGDWTGTVTGTATGIVRGSSAFFDFTSECKTGTAFERTRSQPHEQFTPSFHQRV